MKEIYFGSEQTTIFLRGKVLLCEPLPLALTEDFSEESEVVLLNFRMLSQPLLEFVVEIFFTVRIALFSALSAADRANARECQTSFADCVKV